MIFFYANHRRTASFGVMLLYIFMSGYMTCRAHCDPAYSHDEGQGIFAANWMANLPDDTRLSSISWPGTHDTMARFGPLPASDFVICQTKHLWTQLLQGVRALDIRGRHFRNSFPIHHGSVWQNVYLDDVLRTAVDFLKHNPKEAIFLLFKHNEHDEEENTQGWSQTLDNYLNANGVINYIARPVDVGRNPRLDQVRGQIFFSVRETDGYKDTSLFNVQDLYDLNGINRGDLYWKWDNIKSQMIAAKQAHEAGETNTKYYVNFLSAVGVPLMPPWFVASGHIAASTCSDRLYSWSTEFNPPPRDPRDREDPDFPRLNCWLWCHIYYEGTNTLFRDRLRREPGHTGIVFADFPGDGLILDIIYQNVFYTPYQALRTNHGTYLRNRPGLNQPMITQGINEIEEKFLLVDLGNNRCLIENAHGLQVSAKPGGTFSTVFRSADYEVFRKEYYPGSTTVFALKTAHGTYVTAPPGIGAIVHHNTRVASTWERFEVV